MSTVQIEDEAKKRNCWLPIHLTVTSDQETSARSQRNLKT